MPVESTACQQFCDGLIAAIPRLRAFARLLSKDPEVADELVQDTLVQALASHHTFRPGTSQTAWLSTILRNRYFGILRRRKIVSFVQDDVSETVADLPSQEDNLALQELAEAIDGLPIDHRDLLLNFTFGDLSYKEAAVHYGCSIGTIKSRLSRARALLREAC